MEHVLPHGRGDGPLFLQYVRLEFRQCFYQILSVLESITPYSYSKIRGNNCKQFLPKSERNLCRHIWRRKQMLSSYMRTDYTKTCTFHMSMAVKCWLKTKISLFHLREPVHTDVHKCFHLVLTAILEHNVYC